MYTCFSSSESFFLKTWIFHSVCFRYKTSSGLETGKWFMNFCWSKSLQLLQPSSITLHCIVWAITFPSFQPIPLIALKVGYTFGEIHFGQVVQGIIPYPTLIHHWIQVVIERRYELGQSSFLQWRKSLKKPDI